MPSLEKLKAARELKQQYEEYLAGRDPEVVFTSPQDAVEHLNSTNGDSKGPVGANMLVAGKERFSGGVNLWLAAKKHYPLSPEEITQILAMKYTNATTFRLSVWEKRDANRVNPDDIPIGAEIMAPNVTGLKLYGQVAQGNTTGVTIVPHEPRVGTSSYSVLPSDSDESANESATLRELQQPKHKPRRVSRAKQQQRFEPHAHLPLDEDHHSGSDASCEILDVARTTSNVPARGRSTLEKSTTKPNRATKYDSTSYATKKQYQHSDSDGSYEAPGEVGKPSPPPKRRAAPKRKSPAKPKSSAKKQANTNNGDEPDQGSR